MSFCLRTLRPRIRRGIGAVFDRGGDRRRIPIILPSILFAASILVGFAARTSAEEILILQGPPIRPVQEAIQGFKRAVDTSSAHRGPKRVAPVLFRELTVSGGEQSTEVVQKIRAMKPDLVLAAGRIPLSSLQSLTEIPIAYVLVNSPPAWVQRRSNATGVGMAIPAERWIEIMRTSLPDRKRIGVLYDPKESGSFVRDAKAAAARQGLTLVAREVASPKEVYDRVSDLKGLIDAFWMLPDPTVVTPQSVEALLLFSMRNVVPLVTFSEPYLDLGATLAVTPDYESLGRQAGELARRLLDGEGTTPVPEESPKKIIVLTNSTVARKLGVSVAAPKRTTDD